MLINRLVRKVTSIGRSSTQGSEVKITNLYVLVSVPLLLINGLIQSLDYQITQTGFFAYLALIMACNCLTLAFNYYQHQLLARYWIFIVFIADICFSSSYWFGLDSLILFHLVIIYPLAILIWQQDKLAQYSILTFTSVAFLVAYFWTSTPVYPSSLRQHPLSLAMIFINCAIVLSIISLIYTRKALRVQKHLSSLARHDSLTGLLNRRELERLSKQEEIKQSASLGLLLFDLDNFKMINDKYGHCAGDDALCFIVKEIKTCLPEHALFSRFGGDEFCVLVANYNSEQLVGLANKLIRCCATTPWICHHNSTFLSLSIGLTLETQRKDLTRMLQDADNAMYSAKRAGRKQFVAAWQSQLQAIDSA